MARGNTILREAEAAPAGRHPAGRYGNRTSSGRHGRSLGADVSEEEPQSGFRRAIKSIGIVAEKAGKGAAVLLFAAGVGLAVSACNEGGTFKDPDSGMDTDTTEDTDSDIDTESDTDTEPLGPECGIYEGADHETILANGERELLGPVGHWMEAVNMSFNGQIAEVMFMDESWENVDFDGAVVEDGDLASYFMFDLEDRATLAVSMGGIEQEITFCGVYELEDETLIAHFITDNEEGFMHCGYVDCGNLTEVGEYEFSATTTQKVFVKTNTHGFIPDVETGEDEECPGTVQDFVYEESSYIEDGSQPIPVGLSPVPGVAFSNMVMLRGTTYHFCETGVDLFTNAAYMQVAEEQVSTTFYSLFQSVSIGELEVTWTGIAESGSPLFAYDYPGAAYISEEGLSENEKIVRVWAGSDVLEFPMAFSTPGTSVEPSISIVLNAGAQELVTGSRITLEGSDYDVVVYTTTGQEINGFRLTPAEVEED